MSDRYQGVGYTTTPQIVITSGDASGQQTQLGRLQSEIGDVGDRLIGLASDMEQLADRIFGAHPQPAGTAEKPPSLHCALAAHDAQLDRVRGALEAALSAFNRLRELA